MFLFLLRSKDTRKSNKGVNLYVHVDGRKNWGWKEIPLRIYQ